MKDWSERLTRGAFVGGAVACTGLAALFFGAVAPSRAAKGSQAQFKYQTTPSNGKKCSNCTFFLPGKTAAADGTCKVVEGSISPNGYCIAYSPKSS